MKVREAETMEEIFMDKSMTVKPRITDIIIGILVTMSGIIVLIMTFSLKFENILETVIPFIFAVFLTGLGIFELNSGSKKITIDSKGISCKSLFKRQYLKWTDVKDYGISYTGETRYRDSTYYFYFAESLKPTQSDVSKKMDVNTMKIFLFKKDRDRIEKEIIPFCQQYSKVSPFISKR